MAKPLSARQLLRENPFFVGARGGAKQWPELTAYGFEQAALIPQIKAMEILVCRTSDGVLVCSSEPTTKRLTGRDLTILDETWATLSSLQVSARKPGTPVNRPDRLPGWTTSCHATSTGSCCSSSRGSVKPPPT